MTVRYLRISPKVRTTARYAGRAKSHTVEVSGASHAVYVSRPKEVAALIEEAATQGSAENLVMARTI
jgi:pimeloyl-ACP methyl ester carboxylesterase